MKDLWRPVGRKLLRGWFFGAGVLMSLLYALGLMAHAIPALGLLTGITLMLSLRVAGKGARWAVTLAALAGLAAWMVLGGWTLTLEMARGLYLHMYVQQSVLPVMGLRAALWLAVLLALLAHLATLPRNDCTFACVVVFFLGAALWWLDQGMAILWLIPAAAVMLMMTGSDETGRAARRLLPVAAALTLLAGSTALTGGITVPPLKEAADSLRQKIIDTFFFTQARNIFSLANEGYYPQGPYQLGGPAAPTDHPVAEVEAPRTVYLRGAVKDTYTGRCWLDTTTGGRCLWVSQRWRGERVRVFDENLPAGAAMNSSLAAPDTVTVTMTADNVSTMFVPQRIRALSAGGSLTPYFNTASEVFCTRDQQPGDTYQISAPLLLAGDAGLDSLLAACAIGQRVPEDVQMTYTALPEHLQSQVMELAHTAAGAAVTPYGQALSVQNWLRRNYTYSLDAPLQQENVDFVTSFLLLDQRGYCTHFASAMTVMCRMLGLPARYVEGYLAEPGPDGIAHVTGLDGHAWTEIYFAGFGWLTFDATPGRPGERQEEQQTPPEDNPPPEAEPTPTPTPEPPAGEEPTPTPEAPPESQNPEEEPSPEPEATPEPEEEPPQPPIPPVWLLLPLLLLLLLLLLARWLWVSPARMAGRAREAHRRWQIWTQADADILEALRLNRQPAESLSGWLNRAAGATGIPLDSLRETCLAVHYGGRQAVEADAAAAAGVYDRLWQGLRPLSRLRVTLRRMFVPTRTRSYALQNGG